jgi:hypothetical protein
MQLKCSLTVWLVSVNPSNKGSFGSGTGSSCLHIELNGVSLGFECPDGSSAPVGRLGAGRVGEIVVGTL